MTSIFFHIFSILFIWMNFYQLVHSSLIEKKIEDLNFKKFSKLYFLFYFSKFLFPFWIIIGVFVTKFYLFYLSIIILMILKFILFHVSKRHFSLYNVLLPLIINLILIIGLILNIELF